MRKSSIVRNRPANPGPSRTLGMPRFWFPRSPPPARRHLLAHPTRSPARRESVRVRFRSPQLLEPFVAAAVEAVEVIADGILLVVILVVLLGGIERPGGKDVGGD